MVKAVFFDLDGTLMSHKLHKVMESTVTSIKLLQENGILVFLATGRGKLEIQRLLGEYHILFDGYITVNGQLVYDKDWNVLFELPIQNADYEKIVSDYRNHTYPMAFVTREEIYINFVDDKVRFTQKNISSPIPPCKPYLDEPFYQVLIYTDDVGKLIENYPHSKITRWNPYGIDLINKNASKVMGMHEIFKIYELSMEECMAFGDGDNDVEMLDACGTGIAMGNGSEKVKQHADYITNSVEEDGIMLALKKYSLIDFEK